MDLSTLRIIIGIPIGAVIGLTLSVLDGWVIRRVVKSKACAIDGTSSNTSYLGFLQARWSLLMIVSAVCVFCFEPVSAVVCFASYAIDMRIVAPHRFERRYIVKRIKSVVEDTMHVDPKEAKKIARRFYHDTFKKWLKSWSGDERLIMAVLILDEYAESQGA